MTDRPDVTVVDHPGRERFEALVGDHVAGWITYTRVDGKVDMQHTFVADEYEDLGVDSALVQQALDQVRAAGERVVPSDPFVRAFIEEHPEYADLVA